MPASFDLNLSNFLQIAFLPSQICCRHPNVAKPVEIFFFKRNLQLGPPVFPSTPFKLARKNNCGPRPGHGLEIMKQFLFLGEKTLGRGELDFES